MFQIDVFPNHSTESEKKTTPQTIKTKYVNQSATKLYLDGSGATGMAGRIRSPGLIDGRRAEAIRSQGSLWLNLKLPTAKFEMFFVSQTNTFCVR